ncbi:CmlA/FloR family chloramphenicol efflux MFS transporter [Arvimicrobium flavum]|uniref:CmlA/FloR family chloramphenicol efflux MFS transporter n=1 Tax=Arvimicrobium flavum TaxID=3393320 RepID=UPI00237BECAB|nr:CmlA/FloR family chloramphenicol efflux MFS transporter [Mesorhizobium shangrilense]
MPTFPVRPWTYTLPCALALLAPFNLLASLGMDIYLPVVPAMPGILGATPAMIQMTLTLYMVLLGVGQLLFGPISDRLGRRPVLIGGALVFAAASLGLAATSSAGLFLGLRLFQAIGASAMLVALFATIRDVYAEQPEGATIYSLMNAMLAFVPALGPIAGALIAEWFGWRGVFVALGIPALAMLVLVLPAWHETRAVSAGPRRMAFGKVLRSASFWAYTFTFGTAMGSFFVFFSTAPRVLIEKAGWSEITFSLGFATVAVAMIATTRFARRMIDRWGTAGSAMRGAALLLAGAGLLLAGALAGGPSLWTFVAPMWLVAVGIVVTTSVTANGALAEFGDIAGSAVGLHFCIQSIIVGVVGTAFVVALGGDTVWPLIANVATMSALTLMALFHISGKRQAVPRT